MSSKRINIALSIIIAFVGWVYVIYQVDPATNRTYKDVPIVFTNEEDLEAKGIALMSADFSHIEVSVSAKRSILNEMDSDDIEAIVDLSEAGEGENTLTLQVSTPSGVTVTNQSTESITVNTEEITTAIVQSRTEFETTNDTTEPYVISQNIENFEVSGAKSVVDTVSYVRLSVNSEKVSDEEKTFSVKAVAIDDKGDELPHINVSPSKASVTVITGTQKTVPLTVNVHNPDNDEYLRTYDVPTEVTIKGTEESLANVESIETETVDLSQETESGTVSIACVLPEGVQLANSSLGMTMPIKVTPYQQKTFSFKSSQVEIENAKSGLTASIEDETIKITVIDTEANLQDLSKDSFKLHIDVKNLDAGEYTVEVKVDVDGNVHRMNVDNRDVYLYLEE